MTEDTKEPVNACPFCHAVPYGTGNDCVLCLLTREVYSMRSKIEQCDAHAREGIWQAQMRLQETEASIRQTSAEQLTKIYKMITQLAGMVKRLLKAKG